MMGEVPGQNISSARSITIQIPETKQNGEQPVLSAINLEPSCIRSVLNDCIADCPNYNALKSKFRGENPRMSFGNYYICANPQKV
jgi:hypothetical protein